tara:strand:- start:2583 stop:3317 length:735 start_codon:yes stop_codon:yes gene_type:complete
MLIAGGVAALGAGWSWYEKEDAYSRQRGAARKQFKIQEQQRLENYTLQKQQVEKANAYTLKIWDHQLNQYNKQLEWNRDAFNIASTDYQIQFNDQLAAAMVESQQMEQQRVQSSGRAAASGSTSASAMRAEAIEGEGEYGRQQAIQQQNLIGRQEGLMRALDQVARDINIANEQAYANVAFAPELQSIGVFRSGTFQGPERPNQFISGFNSIASGMKMAAPFVPKASEANTFGDKIKNAWGKLA